MGPRLTTTRRALFGGVVAALLPSTFIAQAQTGAAWRRLGVLMVGLANDRESRAKAAALVKGLGARNWRGGDNLRIDWRWAVGEPAQFSRAAAELVELDPDVLVAAGSLATKELRSRTDAIPIVFVHVTDPVGQGFVTNIARPGGNVTGFSIYDPPMAGKWIELLMQVSPHVSDVAVLFNPATTPYAGLYMHVLKGIAPTIAVTVEAAPCRDDAGIAATIGRLTPGRAGVMVLPNTFSEVHRDAIIDAIARHRLPAVYPGRIFITAGGLMSYGVDLTDLFWRAAGYVDRVLKGAKPADLPVQSPTKFELVLNRKTADKLGISFGPALLAAADEVIE